MKETESVQTRGMAGYRTGVAIMEFDGGLSREEAERMIRSGVITRVGHPRRDE